MALLLAAAELALVATPVLGLVHEVKEELDRVVLHRLQRQRAHNKMTRFGLEIGHSLWQFISIDINVIVIIMKMQAMAKEMTKQGVFSSFRPLEIEL